MGTGLRDSKQQCAVTCSAVPKQLCRYRLMYIEASASLSPMEKEKAEALATEVCCQLQLSIYPL